jgi:hypothetical protein
MRSRARKMISEQVDDPRIGQIAWRNFHVGLK